MGTTHAFLYAATGFPTVLFGAALVVVLCFWLAVLAGAAAPEDFDADLDTSSTRFAGVPVSVSVSLLVVVAWTTSLVGRLLLHHSGTTGALRAVLALTVLAGSLLVPWAVVSAALTRLALRRSSPPPRNQAPPPCPGPAPSASAPCPASAVGPPSPRAAPAEVGAAPVAPHARTRVRLLHGSADAVGPLRISPRGAEGPHRLPPYDADGLFRLSPYDAYRDAGPAARPRPTPHPHRPGPHHPAPRSPRAARPAR
ncbi:hypothetical protein OG233_15060 [Streptomyces sp. NBC_01218]|uniref:hypothetical protein n=1 Tax=Streptomyces sp. NBC_01218 TaxID=2903780 RepID=UPI002E0D3335|nr:hypothetical protein OG233_15060 [Streptomyces sp. NBC_01218]